MLGHNRTRNKPRQRWTILVGAIVFSLLLTACGGLTKPKTYTVGVILYTPTLEFTWTGFKQGMTDLGYIEGQNISYIYAGPIDNINKLDGVAQDLVKAKVDLILAISTPAAQAAKRATANTKIPVVFVPLTDPVGAGLVTSLTQPDGNITGVTFGIQEARRLEWLTRIAPATKRVYIIHNPDDTSANLALKMVTATAANLGLEIISREARTPDEVDAALAKLPENIDALYLVPDVKTEAKLADILAVTNSRRLPTSVANVERVKEGALFTFAFKQDAAGRQAARLADQILRGIQPADLPVETTEFFLAINLKTAQAIGLVVPDDILSQADTIYR